ncbi:MAG: glycosyltransferase [Clostridium sp.]|nr:glycosyltransferase [Clostridium sp.]
MNELISVIVPVYNAEQYLDRCIQSIINQTYKNLEIILINDGSADKSGAICDAFAKKDCRIKVIHKANEGVSATRNRGLDIASGEFIVFVDCDDYIEENYILNLYENMSDDIDLVVSKAEAYNPDGSLDKYWPHKLDASIVLDTDDMKNMHWRYLHFWTWGVLYRARFVGTIRYNTDYCVCEDSLFFFSVFKKCKRVKYIKEKLYCYVLYPQSACHGSFDDKKFTEFYAWQDICKLFEGTVFYEKILSHYVLRCFRIYISMLEAGLYKDARCKMLVKEIRKNLKYSMSLEGYPNQYKRDFVLYSIMPFCLHRLILKTQLFYKKVRSKIAGIIKKG